MSDLQNPHTVAYYAATYEAEQASREFNEAYGTYIRTGSVWASPEDYAMWNLAQYADTCDRLVRNMPVWES